MGERLIRLKDASNAAFLFDGWQETLIWSALEGEMGCIWTLGDKPKAALCENGDFLFLAGAAKEPETRLLLESWQQERGSFGILAPRDEACREMIEAVFGERVKAGKRMAFHKSAEGFDTRRLQTLAAAVPAGVSVAAIDGALYHQALQNSWSRDFVSQFSDADDYLQRGIGFAALHNGEMIGGASSYTRYSTGIEIQVETRADWQRKGIAAACCAHLILTCLKRGLYPSWDAANPASAALAQKLGYREAGLYSIWYMP